MKENESTYNIIDDTIKLAINKELNTYVATSDKRESLDHRVELKSKGMALILLGLIIDGVHIGDAVSIIPLIDDWMKNKNMQKFLSGVYSESDAVKYMHRDYKKAKYEAESATEWAKIIDGMLRQNTVYLCGDTNDPIKVGETYTIGTFGYNEKLMQYGFYDDYGDFVPACNLYSENIIKE